MATKRVTRSQNGYKISKGTRLMSIDRPGTHIFQEDTPAQVTYSVKYGTVFTTKLGRFTQL